MNICSTTKYFQVWVINRPSRPHLNRCFKINGWWRTPIYQITCYTYSLTPKFFWQICIGQYTLHPFKYCPIHSFWDAILGRILRSSQLPLNPFSITKVLKDFWHIFPTIFRVQALDLLASLHLYKHNKSLKYLKDLILLSQRINPYFMREIINECNKIQCPTHRCHSHRTTHVTMH